LASDAAAPASTVLYVEDNLSNLKLIERLITHRPSIKLVATMQGRLGVDLAREHRPDLILLDLHLPDINGDEVLLQLQADEMTRDIPVVMLSADATPRQIERLLSIGARDYLIKPLNVHKFLQVLDGILGAEQNTTLQEDL
jgi:CheY-like chemotaxis protein